MNNICINNAGYGVLCSHGCDAPIISNNLILDNAFGIRVGFT